MRHEDMITKTFPCGCEVDYECLEDIDDDCPVCDEYLFDGPSDHDERMHERRQMGLVDF